jgi:hypothetical protein
MPEEGIVKKAQPGNWGVEPDSERYISEMQGRF